MSDILQVAVQGRRRQRVAVLTAFACLLTLVLPLAAQAHHSRAAFDLQAQIALQGEVTEVGWTNPHFYMQLQLDDGQVWTFEGHSIPGLVRNGWRRNTLEVGATVRLVANPHRDGRTRFALLNHVTREDGATFHSFKPTEEVSRRLRQPIAASKDFTGSWQIERSLRQNLVGGFGAPSDWPLTETARSQAASFDIKDDPSLRCEPRGLPRMLEWPYISRWRNVDDGIDVVIEHSTDRRLLFNDAGAARAVMPDMGISRITHRDAEKLMIESQGFPAKFWGITRGIDSSDAKRLVETYTLAPDGLSKHLTLEIHDPASLTEPVVQVYKYRKTHDFVFGEEPPCDLTTAQRHLQFE